MQKPDILAPILGIEARHQALINKVAKENIDMITAKIFFDPYVMSDGDSIEKEVFDNLVINYEKEKEQEKKDRLANPEKKQESEIKLLHPIKRIPIDKTIFPNNSLKKTIAYLLQSQPKLWANVYVPRSLKNNFTNLIDKGDFEAQLTEIIKHPQLIFEKISDKQKAITYFELICINAPPEVLTKIIQAAMPFKILFVNYFVSDGEGLYKILLNKKDLTNMRMLADIFSWQSAFYLGRIYEAAEAKNLHELIVWGQVSNMTHNVDWQIKILKYAVKQQNVSSQIIKILIDHFKLSELSIKQLKARVLQELIEEKAELQVQFMLTEGADALAFLSVEPIDSSKQQTENNFIQNQNKTLLQLQGNNTAALPAASVNSSANSMNRMDDAIAQAIPETSHLDKIIFLLQKRVDLINKLHTILTNTENGRNRIYAIQLLCKMEDDSPEFINLLSKLLKDKDVIVAKEAAIAYMNMGKVDFYNAKTRPDSRLWEWFCSETKYNKPSNKPSIDISVFIAGLINSPQHPLILSTLREGLENLNTPVSLEAAKIFIKLYPINYADGDITYAGSGVFKILHSNDNKIRELAIESFAVQTRFDAVIIDNLIKVLQSNISAEVCFKVFKKLSHFMSQSVELRELVISKLNTEKELVVKKLHQTLLLCGDKCDPAIFQNLLLLESTNDTINFLISQVHQMDDVEKVCNAICALSSYKQHHELFINLLFSMLDHIEFRISLSARKVMILLFNEVNEERKVFITNIIIKLPAFIENLVINGKNPLDEKFNIFSYFCNLCILTNKMHDEFYNFVTKFIMNNNEQDRENKILYVVASIKEMPNTPQKIAFLYEIIRDICSFKNIKIAVDNLKQCGQSDQLIMQFALNILANLDSEKNNICAIQILRCLKTINEQGIQLLQNFVRSRTGLYHYYAAVALCEFNTLTDDVEDVLLNTITLSENHLNEAIKALMAKHIVTTEIVVRLINRIMTSQSNQKWNWDDVINGVDRLFEQIYQFINPHRPIFKANAELNLPVVQLLQIQGSNIASQPAAYINSSVNFMNRRETIITQTAPKLSQSDNIQFLIKNRDYLIKKLYKIFTNKENGKNRIYAIQLLSKMNVYSAIFHSLLVELLADKDITLAKEAAITLMKMAEAGLYNSEVMPDPMLILNSTLSQGIDEKYSKYSIDICIFIAGLINRPSPLILSTLLKGLQYFNTPVSLEAAKILIKLYPINYADRGITFAGLYVFKMLHAYDNQFREIVIESLDVQTKFASVIIDNLFELLQPKINDKVCFIILKKISEFMSQSVKLRELILSKLNSKKNLVIDILHALLLSRGDGCDPVIFQTLLLLEEASDTVKFLINKASQPDNQEKRCNAIASLANYKQHHELIIDHIAAIDMKDSRGDRAVIKIMLLFFDEADRITKNSITCMMGNLIANVECQFLSDKYSLDEKYNIFNYFCSLYAATKKMPDQFYDVIMNFIYYNYRLDSEIILHVINGIKILPDTPKKIEFLYKIIQNFTSFENIKIVCDILKQCGQSNELIMQFALNMLIKYKDVKIDSHVMNKIKDNYNRQNNTDEMIMLFELTMLGSCDDVKINSIVINKIEKNNICAIQILRYLKTTNEQGIQLLKDLVKFKSWLYHCYAAIALCEFNTVTDDVIKALLKTISLTENNLNESIKALMSKDIITADIAERLIDRIIKSQTNQKWNWDEVVNGVCRLFAPIDQYIDSKSELSETHSATNLSAVQPVPVNRMRP